MQTSVSRRTWIRRRPLVGRRGAIAVMAAFLMVAMVGMVAFSVDVGMIAHSRTEMQQATDAAALAGAAELAANPGNEAVVARQYLNLNRRGGDALPDERVQVEVGVWDRSTLTFQPNVEPADAVRVASRASDRPLFFGRLLGTAQYDARASAIATFQPRDIMLVLDYSGSMSSQNKLGNLKASVDLFCDLVKATGQGHDRIGFVKYSTDATLERSLTFDVDDVSTAAQQGVAAGFTNIGEGLRLAIDELKNHARPRAKKLVLLLTDGLVNRPLDRDPTQYLRDEVRSATDNGYPIVSVSFGSDADQTLMAEAARLTRGVHFHVTGNVAQQAAGLNDVFRKVALHRNLQLVD